MNCREFDLQVIDWVRGAALDAQTQREAEVHAAACGRCRDRLARERALTDSLEQLANSTAACETPAGVEDLLRTAFREQIAATEPRPAIGYRKAGGHLRDGWHRAARHRSPRLRAPRHRWRKERPSASCPSPWERPPACVGLTVWTAKRLFAVLSVQETCPGTRQQRRDESRAGAWT